MLLKKITTSSPDPGSRLRWWELLRAGVRPDPNLGRFLEVLGVATRHRTPRKDTFGGFGVSRPGSA